ncbi:hypothetical protein L1D44_15205 [Shewanella sp. Isolate13]|uniref:HEPN domain-containing protein n=1 Tax=Shewanella sp. Isolate13 TaxID=2908531 RepID=UPI001EFCF42C|nr:HEPN domain-containing protein [Shewanella sp. Isolate13]MCG9731143.1 hypothetical protein [Shewanella sp. Isolate13]
MLNSKNTFEQNIKEARAISDIYNYLSSEVKVPFSVDDLLRSQIVYAVSAFDKLIHDLIRVGLVQSYEGLRTQTPKYINEVFPMSVIQQMSTASIPPAVHYFEQAVFQKLKVFSYQDPSKVSDGLSYIWDEKQKWQKITTQMGSTKDHKEVKTQLKLIADRRNMIVHEADLSPASMQKQDITSSEVIEIIDFIESCGNAIYQLVK